MEDITHELITAGIDNTLQSIEDDLTDLILYMDFDEDVNDLTEALNHVRNVQERREEMI